MYTLNWCRVWAELVYESKDHGFFTAATSACSAPELCGCCACCPAASATDGCSGSSGCCGSRSTPSPASFPASSSCLYLRRFFLSALAAFFCLILPTTAERLRSPWRCSSSFWASSSRASLRFWSRDLVACDLTTRPVGVCLSCTAEFVLF